MVVTYEEDYLKELYETGTTSNKKYRFQPEIVRAYAKCIYRLEEVDKPEALYKYHSLNFEALKGDKKGLYSIRVNDKYRIEFTIEDDGAEPITKICNILDLSNHYK